MRSRSRLPRSRAVALTILLLVGLASLAACGASAGSFSPTGPCTVDGRTQGAYPDLEASLPTSLTDLSAGTNALDPRPPTTVDSGRSCSAQALGPLAEHGITELRFAGATWDEGGGNGIVSAVFQTAEGQPKLDYRWMEEFYSAGAHASTKTENIQESRPTVELAGPVYRLDALNDLSLQTVVVWPSGSLVRVVIVATQVQPGASRDAHERLVAEAVQRSAIQPAPCASGTTETPC